MAKNCHVNTYKKGFDTFQGFSYNGKLEANVNEIHLRQVQIEQIWQFKVAFIWILHIRKTACTDRNVALSYN